VSGVPAFLRRGSAAVLLFLASCDASSPSTVEPHGPGAERVATLWWVMLVASSVVVLVVAALLLAAILRRRRPAGSPDTEPRWTTRLVLGGGVIVPLLVLSGLWALTLRDLRAMSRDCDGARTTVEVYGERWWWRVFYPEAGFETANDIRIPAGEPVEFRLETSDVIHSFWVPELGVKMDMVPGRTNVLCLQADEPGVYRGQCAEFCGLQHANMAFFVVAEPPASFDSWLAREAGDARPPADTLESRGQQVFVENACAGCHTIRGVTEEGTVGPDLTHFGGRRSIGAGTIPNTLQNLLAWISDSQSFKPGNRMPPIPLTTEQLDAVAAYLESLD
jgi:cytochrome c oxidase subunit 2